MGIDLWRAEGATGADSESWHPRPVFLLGSCRRSKSSYCPAIWVFCQVDWWRTSIQPVDERGRPFRVPTAVGKDQISTRAGRDDKQHPVGQRNLQTR